MGIFTIFRKGDRSIKSPIHFDFPLKRRKHNFDSLYLSSRVGEEKCLVFVYLLRGQQCVTKEGKPKQNTKSKSNLSKQRERKTYQNLTTYIQ